MNTSTALDGAKIHSPTQSPILIPSHHSRPSPGANVCRKGVIYRPERHCPPSAGARARGPAGLDRTDLWQLHPSGREEEKIIVALPLFLFTLFGPTAAVASPPHTPSTCLMTSPKILSPCLDPRCGPRSPCSPHRTKHYHVKKVSSQSEFARNRESHAHVASSRPPFELLLQTRSASSAGDAPKRPPTRPQVCKAWRWRRKRIRVSAQQGKGSNAGIRRRMGRCKQRATPPRAGGLQKKLGFVRTRYST